MTRWHEDHTADEDTSRKATPADVLDERLKRLAREAKEAEIERRLTKDSPGRRKGKG